MVCGWVDNNILNKSNNMVMVRVFHGCMDNNPWVDLQKKPKNTVMVVLHGWMVWTINTLTVWKMRALTVTN